ncbi:divergent PAP2 family protein [bacterium 1xD8-48]|mgnify:FL=1|jgi:acid phosphatase family membrane protein YuiD|nr:divergent PAP2 family protein [Lachnospiraceae bacterium]MCI9327516.1 divergent PAP2 family protein [Lachnospiraceae bacterium]NBJ98618.1 divergent PAP2 family protein [bacterium 1xD8-48]
MKFLTELFGNRIFISAALGWFVAQVLKTLIHMFITKQFVMERMVGSGGMPSSHSATVCGLATAVGIRYGGGSYEFAMAAILAIVVMHDAMGVRMETGRQGKVLNEMMEVFTNMGKQISAEARLKEFVGHTPLQVLMGAILGIIIAVIVMSV